MGVPWAGDGPKTGRKITQLNRLTELKNRFSDLEGGKKKASFLPPILCVLCEVSEVRKIGGRGADLQHFVAQASWAPPPRIAFFFVCGHYLVVQACDEPWPVRAFDGPWRVFESGLSICPRVKRYREFVGVQVWVCVCGWVGGWGGEWAVGGSGDVRFLSHIYHPP
jgi:hypothetical protein